MAIDTTVQPWIAKMLMPADGRVAGAAINDFLGGFAGGYLAAKGSTRNEMAAEGETPAPPTGFERLVRLANPEQQRTVDETLSKDLSTIGQEVGTLKNSQDIFNWVSRNAALSASPIGQRLLSTIQQNGKQMALIESESAAHVAAVELAKDKARLMVKYGLGPEASPKDFGNVRAQENEEAFTERAAKIIGKDVAGLITPQDFDGNGNWLPGAQQRILKIAPRSEFLQSHEEIADLRNDLELSKLLGRSYVPGAMQKNLDTIEAYRAAGKLTPDQASNAKEIVFGLRAKESAAAEWMQKTEVTGLVKRREKLTEALVDKQLELDKLEANTGGFTGTSPKKLEQKRKEVQLIEKRISEANQQIETFRPQSGRQPSAVPQSPVVSPSDDSAIIKTPDGKVGRIPRSKLKEAIDRGAVEYGPGLPGYEG